MIIMKIMNHIEHYRHNEDYTRFLEGQDIAFFSKYIRSFCVSEKAKVLDVGCGTGQVVQQLRLHNLEAFGVDVSETNIKSANRRAGFCKCFGGKILPFETGSFDVVGAFNVLEHVDEPEAFIEELVRVIRPEGRLILSSPNFLRVIGFADYHPRMRGIFNKIKNAQRLFHIAKQIRCSPQSVRFERMSPISKTPFTPDDDAIIATNPLHMKFFVERAGCQIQSLSCTDRIVPFFLDKILNLGLLKNLWFNSFLIAVKDNFKKKMQSSK